MLKDTIIYTKRLKQIPISMEYLNTFFNEYTEKDAIYMNLLPPKNKKETLKFIKRCVFELEKETDLNLVILDNETGEFIGYVAAYYLDTNEPEIGYWITDKKKNKGYGKEAFSSILNWIRENYEFHHIKSPVDKRNMSSRKIHEYFNGEIKKEYNIDNCSKGKLNIVEYWFY